MLEILIGLTIPVVILIAIVVRAVIRGGQMRELCEQGIETTAEVVGKRKLPRRRVSPRSYKLEYRFTDRSGVVRTHTAIVSSAVYEELAVGSSLAVVYSAQRPDVSAPKTLVDECRKALSK